MGSFFLTKRSEAQIGQALLLQLSVVFDLDTELSKRISGLNRLDIRHTND